MFEISHYGVWPGSRHILHLGDKQSHLLHVLCGDDGGGLALTLPHLGVGQDRGRVWGSGSPSQAALSPVSSSAHGMLFEPALSCLKRRKMDQERLLAFLSSPLLLHQNHWRLFLSGLPSIPNPCPSKVLSEDIVTLQPVYSFLWDFFLFVWFFCSCGK